MYTVWPIRTQAIVMIIYNPCTASCMHILPHLTGFYFMFRNIAEIKSMFERTQKFDLVAYRVSCSECKTHGDQSVRKGTCHSLKNRKK
jgi:hypothetical protein